MPESYKRLDMCDSLDRTRIATFVRPRRDDPMIVITTPPGSDFHMDAGTLAVVAQILADSPSSKAIV